MNFFFCKILWKTFSQICCIPLPFLFYLFWMTSNVNLCFVKMWVIEGQKLQTITNMYRKKLPKIFHLPYKSFDQKRLNFLWFPIPYHWVNGWKISPMKNVWMPKNGSILVIKWQNAWIIVFSYLTDTFL